MPIGQQDSRRHTTRRILLLAAAAGAAGVGLSLALADDAHASDRALGTAERATSALDGTANRAIAPGKLDALEPGAARRVAGNLKTPLQDVATNSSRVVDETTRSARSATRKVAKATSGLPVPSEAVEEVGDLAGDLIEEVEGTLSSLPRPPIGAEASPVGAQTAPEPAEGDAPTPPAAGSGAPSTLPAAAAQYPAAAAITHTPAVLTANAPPAWHAFEPQPTAPPYPGHTAGGEHSTPGTAGGHAPGGTIMDGWAAPTEWQLAVTRYIGHHHGRTHSPSPPSG